MAATSANKLQETTISKRLVREVFFNIVLSLLFLQFALLHAAHARETFRLSTVLLLIKVSADVLFYLTRRIPRDVSVSPYDWSVAIAGTWCTLFLMPAEQTQDLLFGQIVQIVGITLQILAMLSLNRSIGMVAANRGIQTQGLYRFVRHPMYLSYVVAYFGYVLNHPSMHNAGVYVAAVLFWVLRLLAEERFLLRSPDYQQYASKVRWRMLRGVF